MGIFDRFNKKNEPENDPNYTVETIVGETIRTENEIKEFYSDISGRIKQLDNAPGTERMNSVAQRTAKDLYNSLNQPATAKKVNTWETFRLVLIQKGLKQTILKNEVAMMYIKEFYEKNTKISAEDCIDENGMFCFHEKTINDSEVKRYKCYELDTDINGTTTIKETDLKDLENKSEKNNKPLYKQIFSRRIIDKNGLETKLCLSDITFESHSKKEFDILYVANLINKGSNSIVQAGITREYKREPNSTNVAYKKSIHHSNGNIFMGQHQEVEKGNIIMTGNRIITPQTLAENFARNREVAKQMEDSTLVFSKLERDPNSIREFTKVD